VLLAKAMAVCGVWALIETVVLFIIHHHQHHLDIYSDKMQLLKLLYFLQVDNKMAKEVLKQVFQEMHRKIVDSIDPDPVIDVLFSKNIIGSSDHQRLREVPDRCRELLSLLHASSHPQTFIHLRLALLPEYSWIVDEIDKKLPSLTSQLQQLHPDNSADGKRLL